MRVFRDEQFELVKCGLKVNSEVASVKPVFLNAGIPTGDGYAMNMEPSEAELRKQGLVFRIPPTVDPEFIMKRLVEEWAPASRNMTFKYLQDKVFLRGIEVYESIISSLSTFEEVNST